MSVRVSGRRSYPPALTPLSCRPNCSIVWATPWVLPASTANIPATSLWPLYHASILDLCARGDLLDLEVRPRVLYGLLRAVDSRLDIELARRRYKERHKPLI